MNGFLWKYFIFKTISFEFLLLFPLQVANRSSNVRFEGIWRTHVGGIATVQSTSTIGTSVSTVDWESASRWECDGKVSRHASSTLRRLRATWLGSPSERRKVHDPWSRRSNRRNRLERHNAVGWSISFHENKRLFHLDCLPTKARWLTIGSCWSNEKRFDFYIVFAFALLCQREQWWEN